MFRQYTLDFKYLYIFLLVIAGSIASSPNTFAQSTLPQEHDYQVTLRNWMSTLTLADFDVTLAKLEWDETDYADIDDLFNRHLAITQSQYAPKTDLIRAESKWFVLDDGNGHGIEGSGPIRIFRTNEDTPYDVAAAAVWWAELDWAGNPHGPGTPNERSIKLRALVTQAADMMMIDDLHSKTIGRRSDFLGGTMLNWVYVYYHSKDLLPDSVQVAFEAGFTRMIDKMEAWGPHDVNTNMDTRAIPAFWYLGEAVGTTQMKERMQKLAKVFLFGSETGTPENSDGRAGIFHSAGYIGEQDGPETTYNGVSLYYLTMAAIASKGNPGWDSFMPEVIRRMAEFKSHNRFPDPDGFYDGPSSFSKRTTNSYVYDQHRLYTRDIGVAMVVDEGKYLAVKTAAHGNVGLYSESEMVNQLTQEIWRLNNSRGFADPVLEEPPFFGKGGNNWWEGWSRHWVFIYEHYVPGTYDALLALNQSNDDLMEPPFSRQAAFSKNFDGDFWAAKGENTNGDYGWLVETVKDAGEGYSDGFLGGGSLTALYTSEVGKIVLGRMRRKGTPIDTWADIDMWATHHLWGYGESGVPFSTARNRITTSTYSLDSDIPTVTVTGYIGDNDGEGSYAKWSPSGALNGPVEYQRIFEQTPEGLKITSTMNTNDADESVTQLWEAIPIFLRDGVRQEEDAEIDFLVNGDWESATAAAVESEAIRIKRFDKYAYMFFEEPETMKLSPEVWTTSYQSNSRIRIIHIDMLGSLGEAVPLPHSVTLSYLISNRSRPPEITLTIPADTTSLVAPAKLELAANAFDNDGEIKRVDFFEVGRKVGVDANGVDGWHYNLEQLSAATYSFTARALDDSGVTSTSAPITVVVNPPPVNQPPEAWISMPEEGAILLANGFIEIQAEARDTDGHVDKVEFYAGEEKIGEDDDGSDGWGIEWQADLFGEYILTARVTDDRGGHSSSDPIGVEVILPVSNEEDEGWMDRVSYALHQNFPNPFSERTTVRFDVPEPVYVKLAVFDTGGRHVYDLVDHVVVKGSHSVNWDSSDLANGVYFIRLQTEEGVQTKQATLLK